jgi:uncharacterized protein (UPF0333 family)
VFSRKKKKIILLLFLLLLLLVEMAGAKPTIVTYNASAVKVCNAMSSLVRFKDKIKFFYFKKTLYPTTTTLAL